MGRMDPSKRCLGTLWPRFPGDVLSAVLSTSTKHVQNTEVRNRTHMMRRARLAGVAVRIDSNAFPEVKSFFYVHSHVEQGPGQAVVRTSGYKILRIETKPVLLKHGSRGGPSGMVVVLRREQLAEMNPASEAPMRRCPHHHYSVCTNRGAIFEGLWVRSIRPGLGFEEYGLKIPPIDPSVRVVVRRLKA